MRSLYGNCGSSVEYCGDGCQGGPCGLPGNALGSSPPTYPKTEPTASPPYNREQGPPPTLVPPAPPGLRFAPAPLESNPDAAGLGPAPDFFVGGGAFGPPPIQSLNCSYVKPCSPDQCCRYARQLAHSDYCPLRVFGTVLYSVLYCILCCTVPGRFSVLGCPQKYGTLYTVL